MGAWAEGPFLGFDTETTGVLPEHDRIVTVALVMRDDAGTREKTWLVDPGVEIPPQAAAIHGITTEMARAHGRPPGEVLAEVAAHLARAQEVGIPIVAFNAAFDLAILDAELARHGLPTLPQRLGRDVGPVIDPLVLDRAVDRYRKGKRKLADLCAVYAVGPGAGLHTAEVDVEATLDVLACMVRHHAPLADMDLGSLHAWQAVEHRRWAEGFNNWRTRQGLTGPGANPGWPLPV